MLPTMIRLEVARLQNEERLARAERRHALNRTPITSRLLALVRHAPPSDAADNNRDQAHVARVA